MNGIPHREPRGLAAFLIEALRAIRDLAAQHPILGIFAILVVVAMVAVALVLVATTGRSLLS